ALFGFGFFMLNLLPVLGLVKMVYLEISPVADHFVYLPMIGLIGLVVAGWERMEMHLAGVLRPVGGAVLAIALALLAWGSRCYAAMFISQEMLWTYTLQFNPQAFVADNNLGLALFKKGQVDEA